MKDYSWLAVFSVFTLVVGILFTYGNGTHAEMSPQPVQVFVTSTTTPPAPIVLGATASEQSPQPITITLPEITLPVITVNVSIATSSMMTESSQAATAPPRDNNQPSYTYYVTNNTYSASETNTTSTTTATSTAETAEEEQQNEETATVTVSIDGIYEATSTPITAGQTALDVLTYLDSIDSALALETEDYGDLGVLVTSLGGLENGTDGKYWQYTVNGAAPSVGADQYELTVSDTMVWEFKGF